MSSHGREGLAVHRAWLIAALMAACLFPALAMLRALTLSIYFEPTEEALYSARVGHSLAAPAAGALVVLFAVAIGLKWISPGPTSTLTVGVTVAIVTLLGLNGLAWVRADRAMHPFGVELRAVAAFVPPPGATRYRSDSRAASEHPEVIRYWNLAAAAQADCVPALASFKEWADPGTVTNLLPTRPMSCYFQGRRGEDMVQLDVFDSPTGLERTAILSIRTRRT